MRLTRLVLEDFRSYPAAELRPDAGLTIVAGPNGSGKTNLLEAIFVAVTGRSHRAATEAELVRHGQSFARVRLDLTDRDGADSARVELIIPGPQAPVDLRKRVTVNGLARRPAAVSDTVRAVLFRPEEMLLLVGAPGERRRFMDAILAQSDRRGARDLVELGRILAQRNALLRAIRREEMSADGLSFWDEQLTEVGSRVMAARLMLVAQLDARIPPLHDAVAPPEEQGERVRLTYADTLKEAWPERPDPRDPRPTLPDAEQLGAAFRRRIVAVRQKELWNGVSLVGPQRDDLRVELAGREVATHASRGQQRTIILAMKLAETDLLGAGEAPTPVVLLDDVFSELDAERSERALGLLLERGQVLVTVADLSALPVGRRGLSIWNVGEGRLVEAPRVA
ncbi:MAG TPA: DNA replication and repair protein RecF [Candidatus Saccharimonadales bacterium]|nr:DNA replication and repair protein RecF [Candidatus Saccharimonadales bacterium]